MRILLGGRVLKKANSTCLINFPRIEEGYLKAGTLWVSPGFFFAVESFQEKMIVIVKMFFE